MSAQSLAAGSRGERSQRCLLGMLAPARGHPSLPQLIAHHHFNPTLGSVSLDNSSSMSEQGLHLYAAATPNGEAACCPPPACRGPGVLFTSQTESCRLLPVPGHKPLIALEELGVPYTLHKAGRAGQTSLAGSKAQLLPPPHCRRFRQLHALPYHTRLLLDPSGSLFFLLSLCRSAWRPASSASPNFCASIQRGRSLCWVSCRRRRKGSLAGTPAAAAAATWPAQQTSFVAH